ncbi:PREDICTED: serine/threonine-protein kinase NLK2 [Eufriesea mexicana]|uniref:serine/threonine-protein kinase NLK2 n=2 Tax=Apinae TaxID=70987 RepID=UPI00083C2B2E|nr:PREDICTED: serine/threonine-protein kinase NLK2 [Eufriesea mexicana]
MVAIISFLKSQEANHRYHGVKIQFAPFTTTPFILQEQEELFLANPHPHLGSQKLGTTMRTGHSRFFHGEWKAEKSRRENASCEPSRVGNTRLQEVGYIPILPEMSQSDSNIEIEIFARQYDPHSSGLSDSTWDSANRGPVPTAVTDPRDGRRVALKKLPNVFQSLVSSKRVFRELKMLCFFKHENVLSALDILQPPHLDFFQEIYVITELLQSDLHKIIVSPQHLSPDHIKVFLYQILRGLKYLHSARILHRDIKPGNLLVNSNCVLKICDFGLARVEEPDQNKHMTQEVVTQYYRAPEILMGARHYTAAVDVWSVGCIFGELLRRRILFQAHSPVQQLELITELLGTPTLEDMRFACEGARSHILRRAPKPPSLTALYTLSSQATHEAVHLLCQMLVFDPDKRITVVDALAHPYLDEGRLRYHSCMCTCCYTTSGGLRQYTGDFEPATSHPFDDLWERKLTTVQQVKEEMHKFIAEQLNTSRVPLCINPQSAAFKSFASSTVAHPSELPPSPHQWE